MIVLFDMMAKIMYDEERDKEYQPWTCINNDSIANRIKTEGSLPVVFAVVASQKLNSDIATTMKSNLERNMIDFLIPFNVATETTLQKISEYTNATDLDTQVFYEKPYLETQELINESVNLIYEKNPQSGVIMIKEQGNNRKDRYTSVSYGVYFATLLEQDLFSKNSAFECCVFVN